MQRETFAKIVTVLAICFGIALGSCGLMVLIPGNYSASVMLGIGGAALMVLSLLGLMVMGVIWIISSVTGGKLHENAGMQKLLNDDEKELGPK